MPQINSETWEDTHGIFTRYTGSANSSSQNFTFTTEQHGMAFINKSSFAISLTINGTKNTVPPRSTIQVDDEGFSSFDVKTVTGTGTFELTSYLKKSNGASIDSQEIASINAQLAQSTTGEIYAESFPRIVPEVDDTGRLQRALDSLQSNQKLLIKGNYTAKDLVLAKSNVEVHFYGKITYTGNGIALKIQGANNRIIKPEFYRAYSTTGIAKECLLYKGISLVNTKNITLINATVEGFRNGVDLHDVNNSGSAYLTMYNPRLTNNLIGFQSHRDDVIIGWTNEVKCFGGRIYLGESWSDYTESAYCDMDGDVHEFFGVTMEGRTIERKVKGNYHFCSFIGCRFEATNGNIDIEINGNGNSFIANRDHENNYVDNGQNNTILHYFYSQLGATQRYRVKNHKAVAGNYIVPVNASYTYYLIDASEYQGYMKFEMYPNLHYGMIFTIKKTDSSDNPVLIEASDINGVANPSLTRQNQSVTLMFVGENDNEKTKFIVIEGDDYTVNGGNSAITYGKGSRVKYASTDVLRNSYDGRIVTEEGTSGLNLSGVTGIGTSGETTVTLSGVGTQKIIGTWISISGVNYFVNSYNSETGVATLKTGLATTISGASVSRKSPSYAKMGRIIFEGGAMPTTGTWNKGDYYENTNLVEQGTAGSKYIVYGWKRATTGSGNVLNVDWFADRHLTGN